MTTPLEDSPSAPEITSIRQTDEQPAEMSNASASENGRQTTPRADIESEKVTNPAVVTEEPGALTDVQHVTPEKVEDVQKEDISSSSEQEVFESPDPSIFATDDEETVAGRKRQHSPEEVTAGKKTTTALGENIDCESGQNIFIASESGRFTECMCGTYHGRRTCKHIIATKGAGIAFCNYCHKESQ